jgi:hypothetical protein
MPLLAFILLAVVCLALLGFACACLGDQPIQAVERALAAIPALPALVAVWAWIAVLTGMAALVFARSLAVASRSSPPLLQRFLL